MKGYRACIAGLLAAALSLPAAAQNDLRLPDFGDPSLQYLGLDEERQIGAQVQARLRQRGLIIDDVQLNEYLNSVGQRLAAHAERSGHDYRYYWIDARSINAFAAPGGLIGIHAGLMLNTTSEDELAGVLAHETAHVAQRHIARSYADARRFGLATAVAVLAGIALAAAGSEQAGRAAQVGALALSAQRQINFTRANELEADRIGYRLAENAGFDPDGIAAFFARLQQGRSGLAAQIPAYLQTHPLPRERIADAELRSDRSDKHKSARNTASERGGLSYQLAKARLHVLTASDSAALLQNLATRLRRAPNNIAERYGYALALSRAGRYAEADAEIKRLRAADSGFLLPFRILDAELRLARGDHAGAWARFDNALALYPDDFRLLTHYAQALLSAGEAQRAHRLLTPLLKRRSNELQLFELYAQAAQGSGKTAQTHAALSEFYFLSGDIDAAADQAEFGQRAADATPYERAQLGARLKQLRQLQEKAKL